MNKKYFLKFAFLAVFVFLGFSLGGGYLHDHIHHHATQGEHDDCEVFQLQAQFFLLLALALIGAALLLIFNNAMTNVACFSNPCCLLANPRAPPLFF